MRHSLRKSNIYVLLKFLFKELHSKHKTLSFRTLLSSTQRPAYRGEAAAHVPVGHREAELVGGFFKHQVNDSIEPLLRVDGQVRHLLHQLVELLRRQLVQDTADLLEQVLRGIGHNRYLNSEVIKHKINLSLHMKN